ncbi:hypothetical protein [Luteibacter sp. SG786]|uniref:hypothetical protein n=1 Tax=Luteibacter sp. SG786 TaxID=2587130 RepID=UPI00141DD708|nr:hypothetical protein [Luteibacter sp. SG786]NII53555.1 hypothetical protein [Luteibacter sp. SG786]
MEKTDREKLDAITLEGVQEYLRAKGATDSCMSCGSTSWLFMGHNDDGLFFGLPYGKLRQQDSTLLTTHGRARPVLAMMCYNCGFQRIHDAFVVGYWLDQQKNKEG